MTIMRLTPVVAPGRGALIVSGCSDQEDDLRAWMTEASKDLKPNLKPLPPIQQVVPVSYQGAGRPTLQAAAEPDKKSGISSCPTPTGGVNPLEAYPLESPKMVGVLMKQGSPTPSSRRTRRCTRSGLVTISARTTGRSRRSRKPRSP